MWQHISFTAPEVRFRFTLIWVYWAWRAQTACKSLEPERLQGPVLGCSLETLSRVQEYNKHKHHPVTWNISSYQRASYKMRRLRRLYNSHHFWTNSLYILTKKNLFQKLLFVVKKKGLFNLNSTSSDITDSKFWLFW